MIKIILVVVYLAIGIMVNAIMREICDDSSIMCVIFWPVVPVLTVLCCVASVFDFLGEFLADILIDD